MASGSDNPSQFEPGHQIPAQKQPKTGFQSALKGEQPASTHLPTEDSGYGEYKAAGKLRGKRAIITGGDSGIGRAVTLLFAKEGATSLIVYLPEEEKDAQETKRRAEGYGGTCHLLPTDVREKGNCKRIVEMAVERMGGIDILVNNAAYQNMVYDKNDWDEDQWENIPPYFYLAKYTLPHLKPGSSTIINYASVNPYIGRPDLLDYTSTKGAIVTFTRALSHQQAKRGIRVNCVCPGPKWTPLIPSTMTREAQEPFSAAPMGRPGQPSEVATCFVFLASQDSSFITGQCLHPNGGTIVNG